MVDIYHQRQPCQKSCVSTCIAMLLGIPASAVIDKWHDKFVNFEASFRDILDSYGIKYQEFSPLDIVKLGEDIKTGAFLAATPSLNNFGGLHEVLIKYTAEDNIWNIFDPQAGNEGQRYYTSNVQLIEEFPEWAFNLKSYQVDAFIPIEELERLHAELD